MDIASRPEPRLDCCLDPRVDDYIGRAAPYAQPILQHLRKAVHAACPDAQEAIKWSMPFFVRNGRPLAHMAAFKQHCAFGFWRGRDAPPQGGEAEAMGQFGRIQTVADLPPARQLKALIQAAATRMDADAAAPRPTRHSAPRSNPRPPPGTPADLHAALAANSAAQHTYDAFAPGKQREYVEWLEEAKQPATRAKRLVQAVQWLAEGKSRHWKYQRP